MYSPPTDSTSWDHVAVPWLAHLKSKRSHTVGAVDSISAPFVSAAPALALDLIGRAEQPFRSVVLPLPNPHLENLCSRLRYFLSGLTQFLQAERRIDKLGDARARMS